MIAKNILRLDWHKQDEKENNADQTKLVDNKTYLDWIIRKDSLVMAWEWLASIKDIAEILGSLGELVKNNRAKKDLLIRELKLNIKAFETAQKNKIINYDKLLELLKNEQIQKARETRYTFSTIKRGNIESRDIKDNRNKRYEGKNCEWLFKNNR
jgi:hypothetical protein